MQVHLKSSNYSSAIKFSIYIYPPKQGLLNIIGDSVTKKFYTDKKVPHYGAKYLPLINLLLEEGILYKSIKQNDRGDFSYEGYNTVNAYSSSSKPAVVFILYYNPTTFQDIVYNKMYHIHIQKKQTS